jgi:hypothetical protein
MRRPHCCPICNDFSVETVLQEYAVTAKVKEEDWTLNALLPSNAEMGASSSCADVTLCLSPFRLSGPDARNSASKADDPGLETPCGKPLPAPCGWSAPKSES